MESEIRKHIDKVKNLGQSLNEDLTGISPSPFGGTKYGEYIRSVEMTTYYQSIPINYTPIIVPIGSQFNIPKMIPCSGGFLVYNMPLIPLFI